MIDENYVNEQAVLNIPMPSPVIFWVLFGLLIIVAFIVIIRAKLSRRSKDEDK